MNNDLQAMELREIARRVQAGLTQLGLCYEVKKAGLAVGVSFRALALVDQGDGGPADFGLLEVDTLSLPRKVTVDKLIRPNVIHHLAAVVGKPVYHLNTSGLTYAVDLRPATARRGSGQLPKRADLDLADLPRGRYLVPIGVGAGGPVWRALPDLGHVLVGGATRTGKSVWLQSALAALLTAHGPDELRLALVDPKAVEFSLWAGLPHLLCPIATEVDRVHRVTAVLVAEMTRRQERFQQAQARNFDGYRQRAGEPLPVILAVFDELADVTLALGKSSDAYTDLVRLVQKGAGFGIFVWAAAQSPTANVLGTLARGQLTTRLAFRVNEGHQSRVILERGGAESLPANVKGRMLARLPDVAHLALCQGYYLDDDDLLAVARRLATSEPLTWADVGEDSAQGAQFDVTDKVTSEQLERIKELADRGETPTAIATAIWKEKKNGRRVRLVKEIIGTWDAGTE